MKWIKTPCSESGCISATISRSGDNTIYLRDDAHPDKVAAIDAEDWVETADRIQLYADDYRSFFNDWNGVNFSRNDWVVFAKALRNGVFSLAELRRAAAIDNG